MSSRKWFILDPDGERGPFTTKQMRAKIVSGKISWNTYCRPTDGSAEPVAFWFQASGRPLPPVESPAAKPPPVESPPIPQSPPLEYDSRSTAFPRRTRQRAEWEAQQRRKKIIGFTLVCVRRIAIALLIGGLIWGGYAAWQAWPLAFRIGVYLVLGLSGALVTVSLVGWQQFGYICSYVFMFGVVLLIIWAVSQSSPPEVDKRLDKWTAWSRAQSAVRSQLKTPGVAEFPWDPDPGSFKRTADGYVISGYVDSQNSFGAMLRTRFVVKFDEAGNPSRVIVGE